MESKSQSGRLIVIEGPDGVGKSTLSRALADKLAEMNIPCEYLAFPGNQKHTLGRLVYDIHHDVEGLGLDDVAPASIQALHIAAHLDVIERRIIPALRAGRWVMLDRFWWSTWVYGGADSVDKDLLRAMIQVELIQWDEVRPSAVFVIAREQTADKHKMRDELTQRYLDLIEAERGKYPIHVIDNDETLTKALGQLLKMIQLPLPLAEPPQEETDSQVVEFEATQLNFLVEEPETTTVIETVSPVQPSVVYDTFWNFAMERQEVFFRKLAGHSYPWTDDPIIADHKFTNSYRASDRVSQFLIRHVIYDGNQSAREIFFRTLLFKLFNRIETWELLTSRLGSIVYEDYSFERYNRVLTDALSSKRRIYSAAYIMPSGRSTFGRDLKHRNHLMLLERMMEDGLPEKIVTSSSMKQAFETMRAYPMIGDFLAYQYVTDLNYSEVLNFSETEFVSAGPGAKDGIRKCFSDLAGLSVEDVIRLVTEHQEWEFDRLGLKFRPLWGRPLQFIDVQNLFCEVSKYARLKHPEIKGVTNRTRIKQFYRPSEKQLDYWYPPKWGINDLIAQGDG